MILFQYMWRPSTGSVHLVLHPLSTQWLMLNFVFAHYQNAILYWESWQLQHGMTYFNWSIWPHIFQQEVDLFTLDLRSLWRFRMKKQMFNWFVTWLWTGKFILLIPILMICVNQVVQSFAIWWNFIPIYCRNWWCGNTRHHDLGTRRPLSSFYFITHSMIFPKATGQRIGTFFWPTSQLDTLHSTEFKIWSTFHPHK